MGSEKTEKKKGKESEKCVLSDSALASLQAHPLPRASSSLLFSFCISASPSLFPSGAQALPACSSSCMGRPGGRGVPATALPCHSGERRGGRAAEEAGVLVEGEWVMQATKEERENGPEKPRRPVGWAGGSWLVVAGERERREREGEKLRQREEKRPKLRTFFGAQTKVCLLRRQHCYRDKGEFVLLLWRSGGPPFTNRG